MLGKVLALVLALALLVPVVVLALLSVFSRRLANLGVRDGRLAPCPAAPNCVSTQADDEVHRIEPFTYSGPATEALACLRAAATSLPRAQVVTATATYLHIECTSALFRFVDDVEFLLDDEHKVIHFRSASRTGYSDLGVNRKRMEAIRQAFPQP
jgi:uncharacterized protein (DUF1499 family)